MMVMVIVMILKVIKAMMVMMFMVVVLHPAVARNPLDLDDNHDDDGNGD